PELLGPFWIELAPDHYTKANISGGGPYGIELPFLGADPVFGDSRRLPFVDYLRHCLRWGGFAMLDRHVNDPSDSNLVSMLTAGFERF
ncbi:MAG: hypothetical protein N2C14_09100, partial [Planctomycetales bacterium]